MARFLVDQQLPAALAAHLAALGHDARHIKEYPGGATMPDAEITRIADLEQRVVVTKDDDFRVTHLLSRRPAALLHVTCGNITTVDLLAMFDQCHVDLAGAIDICSHVEINRTGVFIHDSS